MNNQPDQQPQRPPYKQSQYYQTPTQPYNQQSQQIPSPPIYGQLQQTQYGNPYVDYSPPQYQFQQPPMTPQQTYHQSSRNRTFPYWGVIIAMVILIIATTPIIMQSLVHNNSDISSATTRTTPIPSIPSPTPTPSSPGHAITIDGVTCGLILATDKQTPGYVTIYISVYNKSGSEYQYFASDFHLITSSGGIIDPVEEGVVKLAPGGHAISILNFQIDYTQDLELLWQPEGHSNDLSHVWKLNIKD